MASPIGSRGSFEVQSDRHGSRMNIHILEQAGISAENLSLSTWGASFVLANQLHKISIPSKPKDEISNGGEQPRLSVLELGAGTGLVGISAAALWCADCLLTDLTPILPGLDTNISVNQQLLSRNASSASCASLDWNRPDEIKVGTHSTRTSARSLTPQDWKADVVLAADTLYSEEHPSLLVKTIVTWLAPGHRSRAILCYPLRIAYIDHIRKFWELMESTGSKCLEEGREEGDEKWNEVANTPYEWCVWAWGDGSGELL